MSPFRPLYSEQFVFSVEFQNRIYKIFQIIFSRSDGSLFVNFPYLENSNGVVSKVIFKAGDTGISLTPGGKVTSHLVKYTHHPDGNVHFSQDRKVFTKIKKTSVPLKDVSGHIFTLTVQGINGFKTAVNKDSLKQTDKRRHLFVNVIDTMPDALKIVGRWYDLMTLVRKCRGKEFGTIFHCITDSGEESSAFCIAPLPGSPISGHAMLINAVKRDKINVSDDSSAIVFLGGFDRPEITTDKKRDTCFLACSYPALDYENLKKEIGSIDLEPKL